MPNQKPFPVLAQVGLPDGNKVILYDMPPDGAHIVSNLTCETADGTVLWRASPGQFGPDSFIRVRIDDNELTANTWSGYLLWIDPGSGREVRRVFTK